MIINILAAGGTAAAENQFGLQQALKEGGIISQSVTRPSVPTVSFATTRPCSSARIAEGG